MTYYGQDLSRPSVPDSYDGDSQMHNLIYY